jgi:hypothetical protein
VKTNDPDFLANIFHAIYEEDPIGFDTRLMMREFFAQYEHDLWESLCRHSSLDDYLVRQAIAHEVHQWEGRWL